MRLPIIIALLVALALFAFLTLPAHADDVVSQRRTLPVVQTREIDKIQYKCLDTQQWQDVLVLANDYQGLFNWRLKMEGVLAAQTTLIAAYELKINNYEAILKIKDADRNFLTKQIESAEEKGKRKEFEDRLEKYGLWAVVLVETIVIGVLGARSWVTAE